MPCLKPGGAGLVTALCSVVLMLSAAAGEPALPARVAVAGNTSVARDIKVIRLGADIPPSYSGKTPSGVGGFSWYASRNYVLRTDMGDQAAFEKLMIAELAYPHMAHIAGKEPDPSGGRRMHLVYASDAEGLSRCVSADFGMVWRAAGNAMTFSGSGCSYFANADSAGQVRRDAFLHELFHLYLMSVTDVPVTDLPSWFSEGAACAVMSHVFDPDGRRLTVRVFDRPAMGNVMSAGLAEIRSSGLAASNFYGTAVSGPGAAGLAAQAVWMEFLLSHPVMRPRFNLLRDGLLSGSGQSGDKTADILGDPGEVDSIWMKWLDERRPVFQAMDGSWDHEGVTLTCLAYPVAGAKYSFAGINLGLPWQPADDGYTLDFPLAAQADYGGLAGGGPSREPAFGCIVMPGGESGQDPVAGGMALKGGGGMLLLAVSHDGLEIDPVGITAKGGRAGFDAAFRAAIKSGGGRIGLVVSAGDAALTVTVRAGGGASLKELKTDIPMDDSLRTVVSNGTLAVFEGGPGVGVVPVFINLPRRPVDMQDPAPIGRWRFRGDAERDRLYRASRILGAKAPASLLAIKSVLDDIVDKGLAAQRDGMGRYYRAINGVIRDIGGLADAGLAGKALAVLEMKGSGGILLRPLDVVLAGGPAVISGVEFSVKDAEPAATGKLFWRRSGDREYREIGMTREPDGKYSVTLPGEATAGDFEYFIEMQAGGRIETEPHMGRESPFVVVPDRKAPEAVANFTSVSVKSYSVEMRWDAVGDDTGVSGYEIFSGNAPGFAPEPGNRRAEVFGTVLEWRDVNPPAGRKAYYAVRAVDLAGRYGAVARLVVDVPAAQAPENGMEFDVKAGMKSVILSWSGNAAENVVEYQLLRRQAGEKDFRIVASVTNLAMNGYIDRNNLLAGVEYAYTMRLKDSAGLYSKASPVVLITPFDFVKRINCGGDAVPAEDGVDWEADAGKRPYSSIYRVTDDIANAGKLQDVYRSERWSYENVMYLVPVEPGSYEVVLHFAETHKSFMGEGKRTFDIYINNERYAEKFDVFAKVGGLAACQFRQAVNVTEDRINVQIVANPSGPNIRGIEIYRK